MYPIDGQRLRELKGGRLQGIGPNVFFLGLTSMLTDISSEMVTSILPVYMALALRLTPVQLGLVDGIAQAAASVARLCGGLLADRWQRQREVAAAGYALSASSRLALLAAGGAWGPLSAALALDRVGKGLRTAPRDALISLSAAPSQLGLAFGVHRAFDTAGALLGPLVAFALLAALPGAYDAVFVVSFCIAALGLSVLLIFVRNAGPGSGTPTAPRPTFAAAVGLLRLPPMRRLVLSAAALSLVTVGDSFFYLVLYKRADLPASLFPLLYVVTASTYLLLAVPVGRLGDRLGRGRVFVLGHLLLVGAGLALLLPGDGRIGAVAALGLLGAYYACTDGVLMAAASALLPESLRASGLAIVTTTVGLSRLLASVGFGVLWQQFGIEAALASFCFALAVVITLTARTWWRATETR